MYGKVPREIREIIRSGKWDKPTPGLAPKYAQANLVVLPKDLSYDFLLFCQRNKKPCPILEVLDLGSYQAKKIAPSSDIRYDLPKYRIYRYGELMDEVSDIASYWQDDFVGFLIGCSFTFEADLIEAGLPVKHIQLKRNVPMYKTNIDCEPAGVFKGKMTVSMRPFPPHLVAQAVTITAKYPDVHGSPIHIGSPEVLGIRDIKKPDFGNSVPIENGEVPVFWACGVTPQTVIMDSKPELVITHSPGHMFITDIKNSELAKG